MLTQKEITSINEVNNFQDYLMKANYTTKKLTIIKKSLLYNDIYRVRHFENQTRAIFKEFNNKGKNNV